MGVIDDFNDIFSTTFNTLVSFEKNMTSGYKKYNLSISEVHMLQEISRIDNASLSVIAAALKITPPSVTVAIKKLESKGMVNKIKNQEDNRAYIVKLSELGGKIVKSHEWFHRKMLQRVSTILDSDDVDSMIKGLAAVNEYLNTFLPKE